MTFGDQNKKILIIKLGAMGDVVRTTPLLRVLKGKIFWVTKKECLPLLPSHIKVIDFEKDKRLCFDIYFDLVLSLDEDYQAAKLASEVKKKELIGVFVDSKGELKYTESSAEWFDMSLISKYGKEKADELKKKNTKTWQEILFNMLGLKFNGEEYLINIPVQCYSKQYNDKFIIGLENRAGDRWPTKVWNKFYELSLLLKSDGYECRFFQNRDNIYDYIKDIAECSLIVTPDTLTLHLALALRIPTVGIFTCTSPTEIYGYGRLIKIVSPLLHKAFYKTDYIHDAVDAISLDSVYKAVKSLLNKKIKK